MNTRQRFINTVGLQSSGGRLLFFAVVTLVIFLVPYSWLGNLSLWQYLGIPSPSIGLTRAYWLLLHFEPIAAWHRNALIYVVIVIGLPLLIRDVLNIKKHVQASD